MSNQIGMLTHFSGNLTTLAKCWRLQLQDGREFFCTEHDCELLIEGKTYAPNNVIDSSAIERKADLRADNLEMHAIIDNDLLSANDLLAGHYDNAQVEVFLVDYQQPSSGKFIVYQGDISEIKMGDGYFIAQMAGMLSKFNHTIGQIYSPTCRAKFCDHNCGLDLQKFTFFSTVTNLVNNQSFYGDDSLPPEQQFFNDGMLAFVDGSNEGTKIPVKNYYHEVIELAFPPFNKIKIGDKFSITQGCDKMFETCVKRYNNAKNFRGEPHLPGKGKKKVG